MGLLDLNGIKREVQNQHSEFFLKKEEIQHQNNAEIKQTTQIAPRTFTTITEAHCQRIHRDTLRNALKNFLGNQRKSSADA